VKWWFTDAPPERLAAVRILVGLYAFVYVALRLPEFWSIATLPHGNFAPVGISAVLGVVPPAVVMVLAAATLVALAAFVLGVGWRVAAPVSALLLLWLLGYRNSWGQVFHTENLLVVHVIALACTPAADAYCLGARPTPAATGYGWGLRLLAVLTVITYVLAGVAKLRLAGMGWIDGEFLRNQIAVDNLRKALLGDHIAPLATPLLEHPAWFGVVSVMTLVLELGAPVALLGGRWARGWALGAWGFHVGVILMMNIWFPYPLLGMAYLPLLNAERVIEIARRRRNR
jgi:hypothetical protein